jgi:hypothetical protein
MARLLSGFLLIVCLGSLVLATKPNSAERDYITLRHNQARENPSPPSDGPIRPISYQSTGTNGLRSMEDVASAYANQCILAHNPDRGAGFPSGYNVGENIAAFAWSGSTPSNTVQGFFGQVRFIVNSFVTQNR